MKNLQINTEKFRIVTRRDIHPGAQMAQANHSEAKFEVEYPAQFKDWYENSQYIACLSIEDEKSLLALAEKLRKKGVAVSVFREPDYNNQATSIAIESCETAARFTTHLPLALKEYYEMWANSMGITEDVVSNYHINNIKKRIAS